tara:strand:- start:515 stop:802 length:288 start_codon:yes stop_codon:yes gene_type:complete
MKLKSISNNETEITTETGTRILFSYETPVAVINSQGDCFTTEKKYSNTTTRHINKWVNGLNYTSVPQPVINLLIADSILKIVSLYSDNYLTNTGG